MTKEYYLLLLPMSIQENPFQRIETQAKEGGSKKETFERLFQTGTIEEITHEEVPLEVLGYFEGMSSRFISPAKYRPRNFTHYYRIIHKDIPGFFTYVADQDKVYDKKNSQVLEKNVYLYEVVDGQKVGHGELRYQPNAKNQDLYFKDRPFVGYSGTEQGYRQQGLGRKRLLAMNAYAQMEWGLPLYSGDQNETADHVWQSLLKEGLAEEVATGRSKLRKRYRVASPKEGEAVQ